MEDCDNESLSWQRYANRKMTDCGINELSAADKYYTSQAYFQLADETTEFYKKSWQEIYEMLKQELKSNII
jgi:hypothetical protein